MHWIVVDIFTPRLCILCSRVFEQVTTCLLSLLFSFCFKKGKASDKLYRTLSSFPVHFYVCTHTHTHTAWRSPAMGSDVVTGWAPSAVPRPLLFPPPPPLRLGSACMPVSVIYKWLRNYRLKGEEWGRMWGGRWEGSGGMRSCDIAAAASLRISVFSLREREPEPGGER